MFSKVLEDSTEQLVDRAESTSRRKTLRFYEDSMNSCLPKATKAV